MPEETPTSESMDLNDDIDIFADDDDMDFPVDQTSETGEEVTETQQETPADNARQTEQQTQQETPFLDIVYNGQQMHLTKEQAITLAQKGQNYDKVMQQLDAARNSREKQLLNQLAQQSGMPYDQFLNSFAGQIKQANVQVRAEKLMQTGAMDQATAMRLAQAEIEKEELLKQRSVEQNQRNMQQQQFVQRQRAEQQRKEQFTREIADIVKEYPDFAKTYPTVESMPKVMQDAIFNGTSIKAAHQQVVIEQQRNEIAALKQNEKNKAMSPGSASGIGPKEVDSFLLGFDGDD